MWVSVWNELLHTLFAFSETFSLKNHRRWECMGVLRWYVNITIKNTPSCTLLLLLPLITKSLFTAFSKNNFLYLRDRINYFLMWNSFTNRRRRRRRYFFSNSLLLLWQMHTMFSVQCSVFVDLLGRKFIFQCGGDISKKFFGFMCQKIPT